MNAEEVHSILEDVEFSDWVFEVRAIENPPGVGGVSLMRVSFLPWGEKGGEKLQHGRWWYIGSNAVKSEVVQTALLAVLTAVEHEVREDFTYQGRKIFSPTGTSMFSSPGRSSRTSGSKYGRRSKVSKYDLDYARDKAAMLEDAADYIDEHGWIRWYLGDTRGRVCAMGALLNVGFTQIMDDTIGDPWRTQEVFGFKSLDLIDFNNTIAMEGDVQFVLRWRAQEIRDGR